MAENKTICSKPQLIDSNSETNDKVSGFRFITWNIDGLDKNNIYNRTKMICDIVEREKADVVFLQEVISSTESVLREYLKQYSFFSGFMNCADYYTLTLISKNNVKFKSNQIIKYEETSMGCNLIKTRVKIGQSSICFLNTHLESMSSFARTRMDQMVKGFEVMKALAETDVVIFAGDFNITDSEISIIGGLPQDVVDAWKVTGSRKESEFTWNLQINDNKQCPNDPQPRFRFDRIFVKQPNPDLLDIIAFDLIGLERVKPDECFPSDHWGIRCDFKFK